MRVYAFQTNIVWENPAENFAGVRAFVAATNPEPGALLVLPELFAVGFTMNAASVAEPQNGPTQAFLSNLAQTRKCYVLGGIASLDQDGVHGRNEAVLFVPDGGEVGRYRKMYPFAPGGEHEAYPAGNQICVWEIGEWRVCPFVCYDLRFPEVFRTAGNIPGGVDLFVVIASWPDTRIEHWDTLLKARAIENQAYVVGVNRVGTDPHHSYPGHSRIFGPSGNVLASAGQTERVVYADLDKAGLETYRHALPFLADRK